MGDKLEPQSPPRLQTDDGADVMAAGHGDQLGSSFVSTRHFPEVDFLTLQPATPPPLSLLRTLLGVYTTLQLPSLLRWQRTHIAEISGRPR